MLPTNQLTDRQWAMLCHLGGFANNLIPMGNILAPLLIWQLKKGESDLIDDQGKEALNFQLSVALAGFLLHFLVHHLRNLGYLPWVFWGVCMFLVIQAAIAANNGIRHRYPANFRFIK
jgi:uncharacterized protein